MCHILDTEREADLRGHLVSLAFIVVELVSQCEDTNFFCLVKLQTPTTQF